MVKPPKIIVFEGVDGVGKTVQAKRLAAALGVEYLKGGGWQADSDLARRSRRWGNRDRYFSLIQMRFVRDLGEKLSTMGEGKIGAVADRFVLADVAHILSKFWNESTKSFTGEAEETAADSLARFIPEGVWGIILDVSDEKIIEGRIQNRGSISEGEVDTLQRFEAKRQAWLWCGHKLGWGIVDAIGTEDEVFGRIKGVLEQRGFWPEGQVRSPEGGQNG
jgi:thymidylate kinase